MTADEPLALADPRWRLLAHAPVVGRRGRGVGLVAVLSGCSASQPQLRRAEPALLEDATLVRDWDGIVRPDALYMLAALLAASGEGSKGCPSVVHTPSQTRVRGGCTDAAGDSWVGNARMRGRKDGATDVRLSGFGTAKLTADGRVRVDEEPMRVELDVHVELDEPHGGAGGPTWLSIDYQGHRDADGRWYGEGDIAAEARGRVRARTSGMLVDDEQCPH
jgi:hypothetical protein